MDLKLSDNIRSFRKQRRMTQEQLAEVLNVTAGAVYKWESGLSVPDLSLIVEMADLFDTSVDVLLGYDMKDNRIESVKNRLKEYIRVGNKEALSEAKKALQKYPNSFEIVHACANVYSFFGAGNSGKENILKALELLEQSRILIGQNTDPRISEQTILREMAGVYSLLGEKEKAIELLIQHNTEGMFSGDIGVMMALETDRLEESETYLSEGFLFNTIELINTILGYAILFIKRSDFAMAKRVLNWGKDFLKSIRNENVRDFTGKIDTFLLIMLAHTEMKTGNMEKASEFVCQAAQFAKGFDQSPDYGMTSFLVVKIPEDGSGKDSLGLTAAESIETLLGYLKNRELETMWKEAYENE